MVKSHNSSNNLSTKEIVCNQFIAFVIVIVTRIVVEDEKSYFLMKNIKFESCVFYISVLFVLIRQNHVYLEEFNCNSMYVALYLLLL